LGSQRRSRTKRDAPSLRGGMYLVTAEPPSHCLLIEGRPPLRRLPRRQAGDVIPLLGRMSARAEDRDGPRCCSRLTSLHSPLALSYCLLVSLSLFPESALRIRLPAALLPSKCRVPRIRSQRSQRRPALVRRHSGSCFRTYVPDYKLLRNQRPPLPSGVQRAASQPAALGARDPQPVDTASRHSHLLH